MITRLEYIDLAYNHYKFWEAELSHSCTTLITRWGRIGTAGQSKSDEFASHSSAFQEFQKKVAEKRRKGYQEVAFSRPEAATPIFPTSSPPQPNEAVQEETTTPKGHRSLSQYMSL